MTKHTILPVSEIATYLGTTEKKLLIAFARICGNYVVDLGHGLKVTVEPISAPKPTVEHASPRELAILMAVLPGSRRVQ
jgi:hypothetical protein